MEIFSNVNQELIIIPTRQGEMMYVIIDNYDSFVHNLAVYFQELNRKVEVIRNDQI